MNLLINFMKKIQICILFVGRLKIKFIANLIQSSPHVFRSFWEQFLMLMYREKNLIK